MLNYFLVFAAGVIYGIVFLFMNVKVTDTNNISVGGTATIGFFLVHGAEAAIFFGQNGPTTWNPLPALMTSIILYFMLFGPAIVHMLKHYIKSKG